MSPTPDTARADDGVRRPPGPQGSLHLRGMRAAPLDFLREMARDYGDITCHEVDGEVVYLANRPDLARVVLHDRFANFVKAGTPDQAMLSPLLGNGLLTSDGPAWERQRRMCAPAFRPAVVDTFDGVITDAARALLQRWQSAAGDGTPVRLDHDFTALTLTVVMRAVIGYDMTGIGGGFGQAVDEVNRHLGHYGGGHYDGEGATPTADAARSRREFLRAKAFLERVVQLVIAARRAVGSAEQNLLTTMLAAHADAGGDDVADEELRDQVLTIVMAGHETTAKALTWTCYLLEQHPGIQAQLVDELSAVLGGAVPLAADLPELVRCRAVIEESMRLYPPVWLISRRSVEPDTLGGYDVPAGTLVCISPYILHRHPDHWEDPEVFRPDRFMPGAGAGRASHAYLPFGGGPRLCIGRHFALTEAVLVLATILQSTRLELTPGQLVEPEALVTLRPRNGVHVLPRSR